MDTPVYFKGSPPFGAQIINLILDWFTLPAVTVTLMSPVFGQELYSAFFVSVNWSCSYPRTTTLALEWSFAEEVDDGQSSALHKPCPILVAGVLTRCCLYV